MNKNRPVIPPSPATAALACELESSSLIGGIQTLDGTTVTESASLAPNATANIRGKARTRRHEHLKATINHFDNLSAQYDHYACKRLDYLEAVDNIILSQIDRHHPCSYLDVGCGTGRLLEKIRRSIPDSRGKGIDISHQMVRICLDKGLDVFQSDFFAYQPDTPFDVVFLEFNVFGYLIVQNGLTDTANHLRRLVRDKGCIIFDILNPLCLTYDRLRQTMPTAIQRCSRLIAQNGESHFTYSVNGNPITMGLAWSGKVEEQFRTAGYTVKRHLIKYADHRWLKPMPRLFTSQFLFVISR